MRELPDNERRELERQLQGALRAHREKRSKKSMRDLQANAARVRRAVAGNKRYTPAKRRQP